MPVAISSSPAITMLHFKTLPFAGIHSCVVSSIARSAPRKSLITHHITKRASNSIFHIHSRDYLEHR